MSNQQSKTNEKKIGCPILEFFAIFSSFHHQLSLILHRITAWDNVQYLVELRPPKEFVAQIRTQQAQIRAEMILSILMLSGVHSNLFLLMCVIYAKDTKALPNLGYLNLYFTINDRLKMLARHFRYFHYSHFFQFFHFRYLHCSNFMEKARIF